MSATVSLAIAQTDWLRCMASEIFHADLTPVNMCVEEGHLTIIDSGKSVVEAAMPPRQPDDERNHLTTPLLVEWQGSRAGKKLKRISTSLWL